MEPKVIIAGGTGLIGTALASALKQNGHAVTILSRKQHSSPDGIKYAKWDGRSLGEWTKEFQGEFSILNLTGKSIDCRPNPFNIKLCLESRVQSIKALAQACQETRNFPRAWIQASAIGFYGDSGNSICNEDSKPNPSPLMELCGQWEQAFTQQELSSTRKITLRIGVVLAKNGGALPKLATLTRLFLGGSAGSGNQFVSWIDLRDLVRLFEFCLENPAVEGTYNATGSNPVTNRELMATLRKVLGRPWCPPAPSLAVKIGAAIMKTNPALALESQRCENTKIVASGFQFQHNDLETVISDLLNRHR